MAILLVVIAFQSFGSGGEAPKRLDLQQLSQAVKGGEITKAVWQGNTLEGEFKDGTRFVASVPELNRGGSPPLQEMLRDGNVKLEIASPPMTAAFLQIFATIALPLLIVVTIYFLILRPARRSYGGGDPEAQTRIAQLERALGQAHMEIQILREALVTRNIEGLSS